MRNLIRLTRFFLSLAVSLSALFSYLLVVKSPNFEIFLPWLGILLLALGTSALNQIQEIKFDSKMQRTKIRPLVTGDISVFQAYGIVLFLLLASFASLYYSMQLTGIYFAIFTIFTYNIVYTYMKRVSYWALVLGSFLGVIAPMIGWIVAGGSLYDSRFIALFLFYFVWQVPHFWLLMLMNGDDYEQAGFPTLKDKIGKEGLMRIIAVWNYLIILIALSLQYLFDVSLTIWLLSIVISAYMLYSSFLLISGSKTTSKFLKIRFMELNTFILLTVIFLVIHNLMDI